VKLTYQPAKCIGCRLCKLACSGIKEGVFNPGLARLRVTSVYRPGDLVNTAELRDRCGQCVEACPTGAITDGPHGLALDVDRCDKCGACIKVCPTGVLRAGYDAVIVEGRAGSPVYLLIEDDQVQVKDAGHLWGHGAHGVENELKAVHGEHCSVLAIGPAGENLVPFACISSDLYRQAGRGGVGAVMGSKNLKAVVIRGTGGVRAADAAGLMAASYEAFKNDLLTDTNLWAYTDGTPMIVELSQTAGILPTKNYQQGTCDGYEAIKAEAVAGARAANKGCTACGLGCGNYVRAGGAAVEGPEYETLSVAGSNCGISDLGTIMEFNRLCDDLGLDTISAGGVTAFATELSLLTQKSSPPMPFKDIDGNILPAKNWFGGI